MVTVNYPKTEFIERREEDCSPKKGLGFKFLSLRNQALRLGFLEPRLLLTENISEMIGRIRAGQCTGSVPCDRSIDRAVRLAKQFLRDEVGLVVDDQVVRRMEGEHRAVFGGEV